MPEEPPLPRIPRRSSAWSANWSDVRLPPRAGAAPAPSPEAPLAGLTLLLVEDSRFASEALRLVAQRCGARLRRAGTLAEARHHLRVYRPDVVLVDLGLPDGRGEDLIADLARRGGPPVLGTSGDDQGLARARKAGAAGFLPKPVRSLSDICAAILALLPERAWLRGMLPRAPLPAPDPLALRDDLARAARALRAAQDAPYLAGFVEGLAQASDDAGLARTAQAARSQPQALGDLARALALRLAAPTPLTPQG